MSPYKDLEYIIDENDVEAVEKYTQENNITHNGYVEYINERECRGYVGYPVHVAAKCGNTDILDFFISQGFDKNYQQRMKYGPLPFPIHVACRAGHLNVVKSLVEVHGVDVDMRGDFRYTPIYMALYANHLEIVKYLVEKGASLSGYWDGTHYMNPLHDAVEANNINAVQFLLTQNIDINANDGVAWTPLARAASCAGVEILTTLLDAGADIEGTKKTTVSPFALTVNDGKLENMKLLYSRGANPEVKCGPNEPTPLDRAVEYGHYEVVRYLVVDLNLPWNNKNAFYRHPHPLKFAVDFHHFAVLRLLLDAGVSCRGYKGMKLSGSIDKQKHVAHAILKHALCNPMALKEICCFKVRCMLGRNFSRVVDSLPLPGPLVDFVKLTHICLHEEKQQQKL